MSAFIYTKKWKRENMHFLPTDAKLNIQYQWFKLSVLASRYNRLSGTLLKRPP